MASKDLIELVTKLHNETYHIHSIEIKGEKFGDSFSTMATVTLKKNGEQTTLKSSEIDFLQYLIELRGVVDTNGEYRFRHLKDPSQYSIDMEHLIDKNYSKLKKSSKEIITGQFRLKYDAFKLIDQLLTRGENLGNDKFLKLKTDYHYILANAFLISDEMLKAHKELRRKYPDTKEIIDALDIIMKSFWPTDNAIKNYKFYRSYLTFDVGQLCRRISSELAVSNDTLQEFLRRGKLDATIGLPKMMDIYSQFIELAAPVINLIRIGLELKRGNISPHRKYGLGHNIEIIRSDQEYGALFNCLDAQIRHATAHASRRIDKAARKVYLIDARGKKEKIISIYTFDEICEMINTMQNKFFQAIIPSLILFDITTQDLVLTSREYKHLLLAVGNIC
jgi:hypothetical protein